ncbi:ATP-binding cassette domain-containing protein, partial [Desulfobaculum sp.]
MLEVRGYAHLLPHGGGKAGRLPDFSVKSGECVLLCGPSGCGKSTFLLAAAGLIESGRVCGEMRRFPSVPEQ